MKVIKIGTSAQSRIAQACDRCRSKKIRCDGLRPCCTQCSSVGFECKTSDKLSRRAFPRGYTESLEERVRALETEVKELKDLLDEKEENIEMLSKISSQSPRRSSTSTSVMPAAIITHEAKDNFKMLRPQHLTTTKSSEAYYTSGSSAKAFVGMYIRSTYGQLIVLRSTQMLLLSRSKKPPYQARILDRVNSLLIANAAQPRLDLNIPIPHPVFCQIRWSISFYKSGLPFSQSFTARLSWSSTKNMFPVLLLQKTKCLSQCSI